MKPRVVFVVEERRKSKRPDYNAFYWKPVMPKSNQREAQALARRYAAATATREYRVRKYVPEATSESTT